MKDDYAERMRNRIIAADRASDIHMVKVLCIACVFIGFFAYGIYKFIGNFL